MFFGKSSKIGANLWQTLKIYERHRHRYEFISKYQKRF